MTAGESNAKIVIRSVRSPVVDKRTSSTCAAEAHEPAPRSTAEGPCVFAFHKARAVVL